MAQFRGTVHGNRGEASRLGHKSGGLTTCASTWTKHVRTHLYVDEQDRECVQLTVNDNTLFMMPLDQLEDRASLLRYLAHDGVKREFE